MSLSRNKSLNNTLFKTLTYSRVEPSQEPPQNHPDIQGIKDFHLPNLTKSTKGIKRNRKISLHEGFKAVTYPFSTTPNTKLMTTTDTLPLTAREPDDHLQAENEKLEILMHARGEAIAIIAKAEKEANKTKKEIQETARAEGLKAAEEEIESRISHLNELLERLASTQKQCWQKHEDEMVKLALTCARRLINREISLDESVIADNVREVFNESSVQGSVALLLNSDDFKLINDQRSQLLSDFPQIHDLKIEVGEGIERGGCILESAMGRIDASLRSKFEELNRLLLSEQ